MADNLYVDEAGNLLEDNTIPGVKPLAPEPAPAPAAQGGGWNMEAQHGLPRSATGNSTVPGEGYMPGIMTNPLSPAEDKFPEAVEGEHPLATEARKQKWLREHNMEQYGGTAEIPDVLQLDVQTQQHGAPDDYLPEREDLAGRGRNLAIDREAVELQENERQRMFTQQRMLEEEQQIAEKEQEKAQIDADVSKQRLALDEAMQRQRNLVDRGISPWASYSGTGNAAAGRISAALTMMAAAGGSDGMYQQVTGQINHIINREVENQKYAIELAGVESNNAYSKLVDEYGRQEQAESALKALMYDAVKTELSSMVLETADHQTMLKTQEAMLAIDKALLDANQEFAAQAYGTATERYKFIPGHAGSSGGIRYIGHERALKNQAAMGKMAAQSADTAAKWSELMGANAEGGESMDVSKIKNQKTVNAFGKMSSSIMAVQDLIKQWPGAEGIDLETGTIIGGKDGFFEDKVPGRGVFDSMTTPFSREAAEYDRATQMMVNAYRNAISGQAGAEAEILRITSMIDSKDELRHQAGVQELARSLVRHQRGLLGTVTPQEGRILMNRRSSIMGKGALNPNKFNYQER